jgi:hypothetical protein
MLPQCSLGKCETQTSLGRKMFLKTRFKKTFQSNFSPDVSYMD